MERLTKRTDKGILVKEDYGENALRTLYQCFDAEPNTHYTNCEEGYCAIEKLAAYEDLGVTLEQIKEFSSIYLDKCEEVNRLRAELAEYKKNNIPPDVIAEYKKFEDELVSKSITFNHVLELIKAEENKLFEESKQPQGDLISRSALIQQLREEGSLTYLIKGAIDNLPTAYDVEKVVEQIHDKYCHKCRNILGKQSSEEYCKSVKCEIDALCDIVKKGGVEQHV